MNEQEFLINLLEGIAAFKETALNGIDEHSAIYKAAEIAYNGLTGYITMVVNARVKRLKEVKENDNK